MPQISLPNNWDPRVDQLPLWKYLANGGRRAVVRAHRRWGKDDVALNFGAVSSIQTPGMYWHCLPEYSQGRKAIWDAVDAHTGRRRIDQAFPHEIRRKTRNDEMLLEFASNSTWQVVGSDSFNKLVGAGPRGLVFSEAALAAPEAWDYMQPMVEESGGWVIFISTVRGRNWFYQLGEYAKTDPDWYFADITVDDTDVFSKEQLKKIKGQLIARWGEDLGTAIYRQEYYNDPDVSGFRAFITGQLVAKCRAMDAFVAEGEPIAWGLDVARDGADKSALAIREGRKVHSVEAFRETDTMRLCDMIAQKYNNTKNKPDIICVDGIGMGAPVVDQLRRMLGAGMIADIKASEKALNEAKYRNKRAEMWGNMRDALESGVDLPNDQALCEELVWPLAAYEKISERLMLEDKDAIRERHGGSPDKADALALTYATIIVRRRSVNPIRLVASNSWG